MKRQSSFTGVVNAIDGNGPLSKIFSVDDGSSEPATFILLGTGAAPLAWLRRHTISLRV